MRAHRLAVQASVSPVGVQAALVGIAVTDGFEIVFQSPEATRKVRNFRRNPRIAIVIGAHEPGDERTVQFEGVVDEPRGSERDRLVEAYRAVWPSAGERPLEPGLTCLRARPTWIRFSDRGRSPVEVIEYDGPQLRAADVVSS